MTRFSESAICRCNQQGETTSRRDVLQRALVAGIGAPAIAGSIAAMAPTLATAQEAEAVDYSAGVQGGTLRVAMPSDLPTLDIATTSNVFPGQVVWAVCEPLFTFDASFSPIPMLAETHDQSEDFLIHTITLRQGVPFHDGGEMTAADVVASMQRWLELSASGQAANERLSELVQVDDYTIEIRLSEPYGALLPALSLGSRGCPIYPQAFVEAAGSEPVESLVGTGPYRFIEWQPDRFIRLERFEEYQGLEGEPDGYGGAKHAFADEIVYTPVPDVAARVAGLLAGDYDYLSEVSNDQFEALQSSSDVTVEQLPVPFTKFNLIMNMNSPILADLTVRQALQATVDSESVMLGSVGEGFYRLDPAIMMEGTQWHTNVGGELYNQADPEKGAQLLEESSYDGSALRLVTSVRHESRAIIVAQQLEAIGVTVDLQIVEQNTFNQITQQTDDWELTVGGFTFVPDPSMMAMLQMCPFLGHWCDPESTELPQQVLTEPLFEDRFAALEALQQNYFEQVPYVLLGDWIVIQARRANVQGQIVQTALGTTYWNMWLG